MVRRIKEAGAVVLAKSNMDEFAFSPYETVSSILPGYTRNPYALDRVTAGSSGGTAAAVAANLGAVGLGTDTGNSIRGPSSHQALVGIRSTLGLTSRAGVVPLLLWSDIAGPMARSVADAVAVFQVVVGPDPNDPVTEAARSHPVEDYRSALVRDGLRGARIGVLPQAYDSATTDPEIFAVFHRALADLGRAGATVTGPVRIDSLEAWQKEDTDGCFDFKHDLEQWLAAQGDRVPVKTLDAIIKSRKFHPSIEKGLETAQAMEGDPATHPACLRRAELRTKLRAAVLAVMDRDRLDALVYPTWSNPPRKIGDLNTPAGDNNQVFSPTTGFPAITVPMGWTRGGALPAGLQFFGRPWEEKVLIRLAYGYEQATHHRRPPRLAR
jgi:Asp-tRNA(Asn)/Glu-tRNA(Gln) amidotransferase A subunit family amidase